MLNPVPVMLLGSFCMGASCIRMLADVLNNGEVGSKSIAAGLIGLTVLVIGLHFYNKNKKINEMPDVIPVPLLGAFCLGVSVIMSITDTVNKGMISWQAIGAGVMGLLFLAMGLYVYNRDKKEEK